MPANAVKIARPTEWGNPYRIVRVKEAGNQWWVETDASVWFHETQAAAHHKAVLLYEEWLKEPHNQKLLARAGLALKGKDLACWCRPELACHADVLLRMVNT